MGHTERHIDKTDEILIHRLLKDWKVYSGTFFNDMTNEFYQKVNKMNLKEGRNEIILKFDQVIGYGYDRSFEKITSNYARVIVEKFGKKIEIITAYPELILGQKTGEKFDFTDKNFDIIAKESGDICYNTNSYLWELFLFLTKCSILLFCLNRSKRILEMQRSKLRIQIFCCILQIHLIFSEWGDMYRGRIRI